MGERYIFRKVDNEIETNAPEEKRGFLHVLISLADAYTGSGHDPASDSKNYTVDVRLENQEGTETYRISRKENITIVSSAEQQEQQQDQKYVELGESDLYNKILEGKDVQKTSACLAMLATASQLEGYSRVYVDDIIIDIHNRKIYAPEGCNPRG